jgi:DNA ligase D-like protein (predicted 3'-phosphoesterase)
MSNRLEHYRKKRDFRQSPEPRGKKSGTDSSKPIFVVQKHDATNLHYDFRLEADGVLVSWAIPKGPSVHPKQKRLAMRTEDHPLDYADFEGHIPDDQYGGGDVIVWDTGSYRNLREKEKEDGKTMSESLKEGKIQIELKGRKLKGNFYLIRTGRKNKEQWLFIKAKNKAANKEKNLLKSEPESVISGKTIEDLKQ